MEKTHKYESRKWIFEINPGLIIGCGLIASSLYLGLVALGQAIKTTPATITIHPANVTVNERAVQFGTVTKGYEVKKKQND